jgi:aminocarboxymuconate-semialdehyde decarboxylase
VGKCRTLKLGVDRIVFASDCPFDPEGGPMFIHEGIRSLEELQLSEEDTQKIYYGNALRLLRLPRSQTVPGR